MKNIDYEPRVKEPGTAQKEVNRISSDILDWMNLKGKVTEGGASVNVCEEVDPDFNECYLIRHSWSIYDLTSGSFEEGMENIRDKISKNGWRITRDGETNSRARNPEIIAVNPRSHHTATIEWMKERSGNLKKLIFVMITSRCYKAPAGTNLGSS